MGTYYYLPPATSFVNGTPASELLRLALALNAGRTAGELVDMLFENLEGQVPFDRIGVAILEPGDILRSHYVRSKFPVIWGVGAHARLAGTSLEPIVRERKIRIIADLEAFVREHPGTKTAPLLLAEGMRSSLTLPLATASGPLGVMFFSSQEPSAYGPPHVEFLSMLAEAIAIALERARLTDRLRSANAELEALEQLKANFLSNLSHELRTPLTRIMANAEALADEAPAALAPAHLRYLAEITAGADRLAGLLDTLFDFTALEARRLVVTKEPVDVAALLKELEAELTPLLAEQGLDLAVVVREAPLPVEADPPRLAQALRALVDNARKFTPAPGAVQLRAGREGDQVWIEVQDSGIGIAPPDQPRVFDKFFQAESGADRSYAGTGLGLALARAIVLAHGGTIQVRSTEGVGSIFTIRLPAAG